MNSVFDLVWPAMLKTPSLRIEAVYCSPRSFVLDLSRQARRLTEELESAKNELQPLKELLSLRSAWVQTSLLVSGFWARL